MTSPSRFETLPAEKAGRIVARLLLHADLTSDYRNDEWDDEDQLLLAVWEVAGLINRSEVDEQAQWSAFRDAYDDEIVEWALSAAS